MPLNVNLTPETVAQGFTLRKNWEKRFERELVFEHAREMLDTVKQRYPEVNDSPPTAASRNREAFAQLKASLASIRSNNSESFFNETIPSTLGESTFKVLVASDCVDRFLPAEEPPTYITGNIRPHNTESYTQARGIFLKDVGDQIAKENAECSTAAGLRLKFKLVRGYNEEKFAAVIATFKHMTPPPMKGTIAIHTDESKEYLYVTLFKEAKKDPIKNLIKLLAKATMRKGDEGAFGSETSAVDLLRLVTLRIDILHDLADWLRDAEKSQTSWITLLEGLRIAVEVITRDASSKHAAADIAESILHHGSETNLALIKKSLIMTSLLHMSRESSLKIQIPPLELLYALAVDDSVIPNRAAFLSGIAYPLTDDTNTNIDTTNSQYAEEVKNTQAYLDTTAPEELLAATIGSRLKVGATGDRFFNMLKFAVAAAPVKGGDMTIGIIENLLPIKDIIEDLSSIELITPSGSAMLKVKGINRKLWSWIPDTVQGIVDEVKPLTVAASRAFSFDENNKLVATKDFKSPATSGDAQQGEEQTSSVEIKQGPISDEIIAKINAFTPIMPPVKRIHTDAFEALGESVIEAVFPSEGSCRRSCPDFVKCDNVLLPSIQMPKQRASGTVGDVNFSSRASAWDFRLPREVANAEEGLAAAAKLGDLRKLGKGRRGLVALMIEGQEQNGGDEPQNENEGEAFAGSTSGNSYDNNNSNEGDYQNQGENYDAGDDSAEQPSGCFTRGEDGLRENWEEEEAKIFSSPQEREEIRRIFDRFDDDGSNSLDKSEAMAAFLSFPIAFDTPAAQLLALVQACDKDGDGKLDFIEFAKIAVIMKKQGQQNE